MKNKLRHIGEEHLGYNMNKWKKKSDFYILNEMSKNVTLVQLMEKLENVNHAISIVGYWISESNYEKVLHLTRESLVIICSPSVGE